MDYSLLYQNIADQCLQALLAMLPIILPYVGALIVIEFAFSFFYNLIGGGGDDFEFHVTTTDLDLDIDYVVDEVTDSIFW